MQLKIGTCGWGVTGGYKAYFSHFNVIELQDTFNKLPKPETAEYWRKSVPPDFEFTMKAWQAITHPSTSPTWRQGKLPGGKPENIGLLQPTEENFKAWEATAEICKILGCRVLVVQTPPKFDSTREHIQNVRAFFSKVKRPCPVAWEPRGRWDGETIRGLCDDLNLIHVVDPFRHKLARKTDTIYFRLNGIGEGDTNFKYRYTDADLRRLSSVPAAYPDSRDVYVMFNNISMGEDAARFVDMIRQTRSGEAVHV